VDWFAYLPSPEPEICGKGNAYLSINLSTVSKNGTHSGYFKAGGKNEGLIWMPFPEHRVRMVQVDKVNFIFLRRG
jgi:hypothetical protein